MRKTRIKYRGTRTQYKDRFYGCGSNGVVLHLMECPARDMWKTSEEVEDSGSCNCGASLLNAEWSRQWKGWSAS